MRTLVDCGCETKVHADGSGVEIYFCPLHAAAPELLEALEQSLTRFYSVRVLEQETIPQQVLCLVCWEEKPNHTPACRVAKAEAVVRKAKGE
jgi:hypothetical protein